MLIKRSLKLFYVHSSKSILNSTLNLCVKYRSSIAKMSQTVEIKSVKLSSGYHFPMIGLGTFRVCIFLYSLIFLLLLLLFDEKDDYIFNVPSI